MKQFFITVIIFAFCANLYSREYYYYYKGEKQYLALDRTKLNITVSADFQEESLKNPNIGTLSFEKNSTDKKSLFGSIKFHSELTDVEYNKMVDFLQNNINITAVHPNFITSEKDEIGMSSYFYVRLKNAADYNLLDEVAVRKNVQIVEQIEYLPLWYTLRCVKETSGNTLDIANFFYETGLFASAVPDFLSDDLLCTNDPDFDQLWGLSNTKYPGIDIKACSAWKISRGTGVTVAVLDEGIELTHIDLNSNISPLSYDTESNTSPSRIYGDHGTHCAGTIGAVRNNHIQVVGVTPECTLMSISNLLDSTRNSRIKRAAGINWTWKHGADIISNSWSSNVQYDAIDEAIDSASARRSVSLRRVKSKATALHTKIFSS